MPTCPHCHRSFEYGEGADRDSNSFRETEKPEGGQTTLAEKLGGSPHADPSDEPETLWDRIAAVDDDRSITYRGNEEKPQPGDVINPADPSDW